MLKEKKRSEEIPRPEKRAVLGSNNIVLPVRTRVMERLKELKETGKAEFWKDENREWHDVMPTRPISGPLEYGNNVRQVNENEYHLTYDLFAIDDRGDIVVVNIFAGDPNMGRRHKVVKEKVTEIFKKGLPFTTKTRKLEDAEQLRKDYKEKLAAWKEKKKSELV